MKLIFERGGEGHGMDLLPACDVPQVSVSKARQLSLDLPQVSEIELTRTIPSFPSRSSA